MEQKYKLLLELVRSQVTGVSPELPDNPDLEGVFDAARRHKLEPFVYSALEDTPYSAVAMECLGRAYHQALFRDAQTDYVKDQISQVLSQNKIPHVFQRGVCLKHDYPVPAMRTMSDIDVLVKSQDLYKLRKAMQALPSTQIPGDGNHRTFKVEPGITVEFHPELIHCSSSVGTGINPGWQYVSNSQERYCREMTEEGFYLNILCHLANHFAAGGVGVRFVLDVWVCRHLRNRPMDRTFVERELERVELLEFSQQIEQLADVWFSGAASTPLLDELGEYILTSSSHGNQERAMLNAVSLSSGGNRWSALWKKVFYPKQDLYNRYDWVRGRVWLLPAAWFTRVFQAVTKRGKLILTWGKGTMQFTDDQIAANQQKLRQFGIMKEM